jgi:hypothetical protein
MALRRSLLWLLPHKWLSVSEVKRWLAMHDKADGRFELLLALAFGFLQTYRWANRVDELVLKLIAAVVIGLVMGLLVFLAGGALVNWALRAMGGTGDIDATRAGLFASSVPVLWASALTAMYGALYPSILPLETISTALYTLLALSLAAYVWFLVLAVSVLGHAHQITGIRVFASLLLAGVIGYTPWVACATLIDTLL